MQVIGMARPHEAAYAVLAHGWCKASCVVMVVQRDGSPDGDYAAKARPLVAPRVVSWMR
jgi:hypothetical protein